MHQILIRQISTHFYHNQSQISIDNSQYQSNPSFTLTWIGRFTFLYYIISSLPLICEHNLKKCFMFGRLKIYILNIQCSTDFKLCLSFTDFGYRFGSSIDFEYYGLPRIIENYRIQNSLLRTQAKYKLCRQHLLDYLFFHLLLPFSLTFY